MSTIHGIAVGEQKVVSRTQGANLVGKEGYGVKVGTAKNSVVLGAAATDLVEGILQEALRGNPDGTGTGFACSVVTEGPAIGIAGAAVAIGAALTINSAGKLITAAGTAGTNIRIVGYAMEAAAADLDKFLVNVQPGWQQVND